MSKKFITSPSKKATSDNNLAVTHPDIAAQWSDRNPVSPFECTAGSHFKAWWICDKGHEYDLVIRDKSRGCPYCSNKKVLIGFNDLMTTHPDIAAQWSDRNPVSAFECIAGSGMRAWWVCDLGHEYDSVIYARAKKGSGCPYCSNKKVLIGFNDLMTTHPEIARELCDEKNGGVTAVDITHGSEKKLWWKCDMGHEYESVVSSRTSRKNGCPYCAGRKVWVGFNDLATTHPSLAHQLIDEKNGGVLATHVLKGSRKKLWWKCDMGHEYQSAVSYRTDGINCPYCSGQKVLVGFNDLATTHPEIAKELINSKNNGILATHVSKGSHKKLWWRCDMGHEYESIVDNRTSGGGCPYCCNQKIMRGFNDFLLAYPHLENEWDFEKNTVSPYELSYGSKSKVWWKCSNNHSWQDTVRSRTSDERGCVLCKGKKSIGEQEVSQLVSELVSSEVILNSRSVISPYELDMYVPDKGIAIEFNGVYWHTEAQGKDKSYHYNKWKMCKDAGIDLVTVWEDSWRDHREVVETMLRSKLGVYDVNARDLTVVDVKTYREANMFFSTYDLYGSNLGNHTSALVDNAGCPVAMLSWYRLDNIVYVDKYASSCAVENGLSTLLDQVKKFAVANGCEKIVGMSENEFSVDDVYELCGFERVGDVDARCWEVYDNTRYLDDDYGGDNIWDCGRVRWEYTV